MAEATHPVVAALDRPLFRKRERGLEHGVVFYAMLQKRLTRSLLRPTALSSTSGKEGPE
jgi:hypothetical protein